MEAPLSHSSRLNKQDVSERADMPLHSLLGGYAYCFLDSHSHSLTAESKSVILIVRSSLLCTTIA